MRVSCLTECERLERLMNMSVLNIKQCVCINSPQYSFVAAYDSSNFQQKHRAGAASVRSHINALTSTVSAAFCLLNDQVCDLQQTEADVLSAAQQQQQEEEEEED